MKDKLKSIWQKLMEKQPNKKTSYLIIIALIALFLLIVGNLFSSKQKISTVETPSTEEVKTDHETEDVSAKTTDSQEVVRELEDSYKKDLEQMLNQIEGVSDASVMINLDSTNIKIFEKDLIKGQQTTNEKDTNGGNRKVEDQTEDTQAVLVRQGDQEVPLLVQTKKPNVRGVFVVAKGVGRATIKMWVIEAISSVLDVPTHKVSVMPKKQGGK